jgi:glycosyltransferase involved in cell wall biosynthesis
VKISVVIPTRNRSECLKRLLHSILRQTVKPYEVIVVDDGDDFKTKNLIQNIKKQFSEKGIKIRHFMSPKTAIKSISRARNLGAAKAKGEVVVFLDDDVIIDQDYLKEILSVFESKPHALGVQGVISNTRYSSFWNAVEKVFYYWHAEMNKCRVLPSGKTTFAYAPNQIILCEWLFGLNVAYRREVFKEFSFNEKLLGYSLGEDKEFSYKIYKKYPESLFLSPSARALHLPPQIRNSSKLRECIVTAYPISFFYNNIEQTLKNKLIFIWSEIGRIILRVIWALPNANSIKNIIMSYVDTVRHVKNVKKEDFSFIFNG